MTGKEIIDIGIGDRLDPELHELRDALREVHAPAVDEQSLRAAFRRRRDELRRAAEPAPQRSRRHTLFAAAALLLVGVATGLYLGTRLSERTATDDEVVAAAQAPRAGASANPAAFRPLMYAPGLAPGGSYSVVRVRIPLSSLAIGQSELEGTIEADVLVGEDGLASGIRFDAEDTLLVSTVAQ
jgi:hypothetical protein